MTRPSSPHPFGPGVMRAWQRAADARSGSAMLFVQSVLARHGQRVARASGVEMVLAPRRQAAPPVLHHSSFHHTSHASLTLQAVFQRVEALPSPRHDAAAVPIVRAAPRSEAVALTGNSNPVQAAAVRALAPPAASRADTLPVAPGRPPFNAPAVAGTALLPSAVPQARLADELPALRSHPPKAEPPAAQTAAHATPRVMPVHAAAAPAPVAQALPPHEIERIADQVMGSIDRRLAGERERRGGF